MEWSSSLIGDVIDKIKENRIVPIIGTGVYRIVEGNEEYTIQEFIVKTILSLASIPLEPSIDNIRRFSNGYRGMTELNKVCLSSNVTLRVQLKELFNSAETRNKITIDKDVLQLLKMGNFPLILTTCNFRYLESLLSCHGHSYQVIPYRRGKDQDISIKKNKEIDCPTIFHLFGYVGVDRIVVITEDDFLKYIHCIQDTNTYPEKLKEYMKDKYLLSLGCDIPDWTFRFLLYSLKEENGDLRGEGGDDSFDGGVLSPNLDQNLASFLSDISYFPHNKVNDFIVDINNRLNPEKKPSIFLSMNSEEYDSIGKAIKEKLSDSFDIWLFKDHDDSQYWKQIEDGIASCDYFMPVVTDKTMVKLLRTKELPPNIEMIKDSSKSKGIIPEWMLALAHKEKEVGNKKYCIPFFVGVEIDEFRQTLEDLDISKNILWPLFYPKEGAGALPFNSLEELTALKVSNHIEEIGR